MIARRKERLLASCVPIQEGSCRSTDQQQVTCGPISNRNTIGYLQLVVASAMVKRRKARSAVLPVCNVKPAALRLRRFSLSCRSLCPEGRARQITHLIANWCARDVRPMGIVDDQGLRDIFAYVEPGYRLPSRTHVTSLLKRQYELALGKLRGLLNGGAADDTTCLAFTTDIWTSAEVEAYLTLTGHFLTADFSLMSCCLGTGAFPERHTGENIADKVRTMLRAFRVPRNARSHWYMTRPLTCSVLERTWRVKTERFLAWSVHHTGSKTRSRLDYKYFV